MNLLRVSLAAVLLSAPLLASAKAYTVNIEGMKFVPEKLEIQAGDTVTWVNKDLVPHTVTASAAKIDSGSIAPNASWKLKAGRKGQVDYVCRFHPTMHGALIVR